MWYSHIPCDRSLLAAAVLKSSGSGALANVQVMAFNSSSECKSYMVFGRNAGLAGAVLICGQAAL